MTLFRRLVSEQSFRATDPLRSVMTAAMKLSGHSHPVKAQANRVAAALRVVVDEVVPEGFTDTPPNGVDRQVSAEEIRAKFNSAEVAQQPYTKEEMRKMFLKECRDIAQFWSGLEGKTPEEMCDGVVFSLLNVFDGMSGGFPCAIDLVMSPHLEDKQYYIDNGEKWIQQGQVINDDVMLHELYFQAVDHLHHLEGKMKTCLTCKWHLTESKKSLGRTLTYEYCWHPSITDDAPFSPVTGKRVIPSHTDRLCSIIRMSPRHPCGEEGRLWEPLHPHLHEPKDPKAPKSPGAPVQVAVGPSQSEQLEALRRLTKADIAQIVKNSIKPSP